MNFILYLFVLFYFAYEASANTIAEVFCGTSIANNPCPLTYKNLLFLSQPTIIHSDPNHVHSDHYGKFSTVVYMPNAIKTNLRFTPSSNAEQISTCADSIAVLYKQSAGDSLSFLASTHLEPSSDIPGACDVSFNSLVDVDDLSTQTVSIAIAFGRGISDTVRSLNHEFLSAIVPGVKTKAMWSLQASRRHNLGVRFNLDYEFHSERQLVVNRTLAEANAFSAMESMRLMFKNPLYVPSSSCVFPATLISPQTVFSGEHANRRFLLEFDIDMRSYWGCAKTYRFLNGVSSFEHELEMNLPVNKTNYYLETSARTQIEITNRVVSTRFGNIFLQGLTKMVVL